MKAYDTLWGYCAADNGLRTSQGSIELHATLYFPCAMALRLITCSPWRRIRLVTIADGLKDCLNPVGSTRLRQLDTSNGCRNHTTSPYAATRLRQRLRRARRRSSARC